jgi:pyridinium-3,5-biscarboxylic acid mononucleotide sulfurtransferase
MVINFDNLPKRAAICHGELQINIQFEIIIGWKGSDKIKAVNQKWNQLQNLLQSTNRAVVSFSGGVDSTVLLKAAVLTLGNQTIALTLQSPFFPQREIEHSRRLAKKIGANQVVLPENGYLDPVIQENPPDRCYHCKQSISRTLIEYAREHDYPFILEGTNADDLENHRPGYQALQEYGILSPLQEVGLSKSEIRQLAKELGLPNWDKPAAACLASRIPYGQPITMGKLSQVDQAEEVLHNLGFHEVRVRHHGQIARIEVPPIDFDRLLKNREQINSSLKKLGLIYITLDLTGFRSGSLNEGF